MKHFVWILLGSLTLGLCGGCTTSPQTISPKNYEKMYRASFEETWRAVQQSIISYPLKVNNMDVGQIQTTPVRGTSQFKPPHLDKTNVGGNRYTLTINVLKEGSKLTKVTIHKDMVLHRDFISTPESQSTDGYEESVILYRIGREVDVERAVTKDSKARASAPAEKK